MYLKKIIFYQSDELMVHVEGILSNGLKSPSYQSTDTYSGQSLEKTTLCFSNVSKVANIHGMSKGKVCSIEFFDRDWDILGRYGHHLNKATALRVIEIEENENLVGFYGVKNK